ncbi:hypothetical protein Q1695_001214 [Nippostrongylus brasiliensis]|nr:hypothetical protein Q1695_001214 [Nippostrongylus brasiliensis]
MPSLLAIKAFTSGEPVSRSCTGNVDKIVTVMLAGKVSAKEPAHPIGTNEIITGAHPGKSIVDEMSALRAGNIGH